MTKKTKLCFILTTTILLSGLLGCSSQSFRSPDITVTPGISPVPVVTEALDKDPTYLSDIEVVVDDSYQNFFHEDPYSQLSKYIVRVYSPDKDLYNYLFQAVLNHEDSVDITSFPLEERTIMDTASTLYEQAGLQLSYLYRVKWSKDYKTINFTYRKDTEEEIRTYQDSFYSNMNHLLYNVAPENYTPYQRFFAVYDYITNHADYTDDMNDETTLSGGSLLVNGKSICGGFSIIANYVLNFVGVPSEYISNEPHAWNIVTLDGKRYHADLTWGAGSSYNSFNYLNTALMNDRARMEGLTQMGFGEFPIIVGYPGVEVVTPPPCDDNRYEFLNFINENYALDIDNNWIYYGDYEGIHRIALDGTKKETITLEYGSQLSVYNGNLYYKGEGGGLYEYKPGSTPALLSNLDKEWIQIEKGILSYGSGTQDLASYTINLNEFSLDNIDTANCKVIETYQLSKQNTFQIELKFSDQMKIETLPKEFVGLVNSKGEILSVHMNWNEEGDGLIIRSKDYMNQEADVTLYVAAGIEDNTGQVTKESYKMDINLITN